MIVVTMVSLTIMFYQQSKVNKMSTVQLLQQQHFTCKLYVLVTGVDVSGVSHISKKKKKKLTEKRSS